MNTVGSANVTIKFESDLAEFQRAIEGCQRSMRRIARGHELARKIPALRHRVRWLERRCEGIPWWRPVKRFRRASALRGARATLLRHEVELAALVRR